MKTSKAYGLKFKLLIVSYITLTPPPPHILKPTRITGNSAPLIDNIFFNSIKYHTVSGNILTDISDHLPNFLIIDECVAKALYYVSKRLFKSR